MLADFLNDETVDAAQLLKNRMSRLHKFTRAIYDWLKEYPTSLSVTDNAVDGSRQVSDDKVLSAENLCKREGRCL